MPVQMNASYEGQLRTTAIHGPSNATLITDAPVDNHGKGQSFSPTDLVGVALGTCMLTTMGIVADRNRIDIGGASCRIVKDMVTAPVRKIGSLAVDFQLPAKLTVAERAKMEAAAMGCPVKTSLHPDVKLPVTFTYDL